METATEIPMWTLADRMAKAREHAKLNRQQMADAMGVEPVTITRWEHHHHGTPPRADAVAKWAEICGVPMEWLITGEGSASTIWYGDSAWSGLWGWVILGTTFALSVASVGWAILVVLR